MSLHVHHGPHLGPLVEILAGTLDAPLADPFTADVISVPTAGMRDWLQQQLGLRLGSTGHHDGIAANIEMVFPGRFNAAALGRPLDATGPWDIEQLTWTVLDALESGDVDVPGWTRADARRAGDAHRAGDAQRHGTYAKARRIADLFDRYAINRPQLLQQWQAGRDGDGTLDENGAVVPLAEDHAWQPRLWRRVRAVIGTNPAEDLPAMLEALRSGRTDAQLPERVAVFGVSGVSAAQLQILDALGTTREVHLFLVHPSPAAWALSRQRLAGRLVLRSACDATAAVAHPLLRSWGRPAMEAAVLVGGLGHIDAAPSRHGTSPTTLLGRIQAAIVADESPRLEPSTSTMSDGTLQIHACHGTVRQLEVLRDALGHVFAGDPTMTAHDVVVLCPDLDRFAPLVQSVFQRSTVPIPVRVTDLSLGTGNPVAAALTSVLDVIGGRCTGPDILGVCSLEPVRRAFGFDDEGIERIDRWMSELGVSWGLDSEHRSRWIPDDITEGTWASALDRILLGAAMPAPTPRVGPSDVVPFDDIDAAGLITAGQLADVVERLGRLRRTAAETQSIEEWIGVLTNIVHTLFETSPADAWQTVQVMETIGRIGRHATGPVGVNEVELALNDVRSLLNGVLGEQRGRLNLRSGAVTVTAMVPVRNIPARIVCVLGLDEGTLRSSGADGDDVLTTRPCVGERDVRIEGRHLLLDALMSAEERLIITCDGSDITTNRTLPLPVLVEELLGAVALTVPGTEIVHRHPRQAFDERNFGVHPDGGDMAPFSFDAGMLDATQLRRTVHDTAGGSPTMLPLLAELVPPVVTVAQMADGPTRPAKTYLVQRLDVRLPRPVEEVETDIPLALDGLASWQLADELLDHHRRGIDDQTLHGWRNAKRRSGVLPPRALADTVVAEVERNLDALLDARPEIRGLLAATDTVLVDVELATPASTAGCVRLLDGFDRIAGDLLVRVEYSRPKNRHVVTAALELAALVVAHPERPWTALLVTRGERSPVQVLELVPIDGPGRVPAARALLETALALHLRALREPIPMFDASSRALHESGNFDEEEFARSDLRDAHTDFVWGETTPDEILAIALADDELPGIVELADGSRLTGGGRAHAYATYFWSACEAFVGADR